MATLLEHPLSSLQAPDLFGTLREVAEFGKEAGARLRAARENLGLSQFDAAVKLEVTEKTVGKWERAQAKPTRRGHWDKIEEVYGISRRDILGEPEPAQLDRIEKMLEQLLTALVLPSEREIAERVARGESVPRPKLPSQRSTPRSKRGPRNPEAESE